MIYCSGTIEKSWNTPGMPLDFYYLKGICENIFSQMGLKRKPEWTGTGNVLTAQSNGNTLVKLSVVSAASKKIFDIKQPVIAADFVWKNCVHAAGEHASRLKELPKFPLVARDLSIVVSKQLKFTQIEQAIQNCKIKKLKKVRLFDVFENEKIGADKKSMALNFHFLDEEKTMTDNETDQIMQQVIQKLEQELKAEIRK
jgi:phenylalanyl-tRNA synthetase beta chain